MSLPPARSPHSATVPHRLRSRGPSAASAFPWSQGRTPSAGHRASPPSRPACEWTSGTCWWCLRSRSCHLMPRRSYSPSWRERIQRYTWLSLPCKKCIPGNALEFNVTVATPGTVALLRHLKYICIAYQVMHINFMSKLQHVRLSHWDLRSEKLLLW